MTDFGSLARPVRRASTSRRHLVGHEVAKQRRGAATFPVSGRVLASAVVLACLAPGSLAFAGAAEGIPSPADLGSRASATTELVIEDRRDDGLADIVALTARRSTRTSNVVVRIRVREVRERSIINELQLFVDPTGRRERPRWANVIRMDEGPFRRNNFATRGWQVRWGARTFTCGESETMRRPAPTIRVFRYVFPAGCFGDTGVRFAAQTVRFHTERGTMRHPDWAPRVRTLSRTLLF